MSEENNNEPKTPLEAAIDKATGYVPGEEAKGEKKADDRDWVKDAYECFVKNVVDSDPTDPVKAIAAYFEKNATDELKAKANAEGKTAEGCWTFIEAVARKALGGHSGHIDPVTVYAIAMHYFQDVPKDWDKAKGGRAKDGAAQDGKRAKGKAGKETKKVEELKRKIAQPRSAKHALELKAKLKAEKERLKAKASKAKKGGKEQGFFFDLLETETVGPDQEGEKNEVR